MKTMLMLTDAERALLIRAVSAWRHHYQMFPFLSDTPQGTQEVQLCLDLLRRLEDGTPKEDR